MNLTIRFDEATLRSAQIRACEEGTSIDAVLREFLEDYAGKWRERDEAVSELLSISRVSSSRRGDRTWTRDDLHERQSRYDLL